MARLSPFRAYRYDPGKVGPIDHVVTQPYDKITPPMWADYLRRSPYNIVRVTKNRNYAEAARYLQQWIKTGVLKQDSVPSFYPYEQQFEYEGERLSRLGFVGLVSLQEGSADVKGHERILQGPLKDRLNLMRSAQCNEGLIFMLYADPSMEVEQLLSDFTQNQSPIMEVRDDYRVSHRVWQLSDAEKQTRIREIMGNRPLYIADGHHRFQTAMHYFEECSQNGWKSTAVEGFHHRTVAVFNMESSGLKILPTHRGIRNLKDFVLSEFLSRLESAFEVEGVTGSPELDVGMSGEGIRIGLATNEKRFYLLRLKPDRLDDPHFMPQISGRARALDVNVLHEGILSPLLGIGTDELASQEHVDYSRDKASLLDRLHRDHYQLSFLLNPTSLEQVREVSESGQKMPQKSTDFYPKLLTGLILMKMEMER